MLFKKDKKSDLSQELINTPVTEPATEIPDDVQDEAQTNEGKSGDAFPYSFYKPDPYPRELVSVITKMLKKMFPDTKKAYLMEAHQDDKKGYLLIVDIEPKYVKIINLYLGGETKRLIGDTPIESILYSKSGTITEGVDPFYVKETAESKANNLASKEFSGEVTFSEMPEFKIWSRESKNDEEYAKDTEIDAEDASGEDEISDKEPLETEVGNEPQKVTETDAVETEVQEEGALDETEKEAKQEIEAEPSMAEKAETSDAENSDKEVKEKTQTKVKPSTKQELFSILNEYGAKKSGAISTVAMAAIREFEFYIPYSCGKNGFSEEIATSLAIDDRIRFKILINEASEVKAVPLFTEKETALGFARREECSLAYIKYKEFAASRAFELTGHSGIVINPEDESIFLMSDHPLLG